MRVASSRTRCKWGGGDGIRMGLAGFSGGHDCLLDGTSSSGAVDRVPSSRTSESMDDTAVCTSKHLTGLVSSSVVKHAYVQLCWTHRHAKGIVSRFPFAPSTGGCGTTLLEYEESIKKL